MSERPAICFSLRTWELGVPCWLLDIEKHVMGRQRGRFRGTVTSRPQHLNVIKNLEGYAGSETRPTETNNSSLLLLLNFAESEDIDF